MRKILKGITFVSIFIVLLVVTSYIFSPKNNDKKSGMQQASAYGILTEEKNTIDTLIIGDSESYSSISPMQLWKEHGYTSYVCGTPAQRLYQSYDFLQMSLKTQKPKIVVLEANAIYRKITINQYLSFRCEQMIPILKYHDRWKKIQKQDFIHPIEYTWKHNMKGFRYYTGIRPPKEYDYMKKKKRTKTISQENLYFLDKIRNLCLDNDIQFILMSAPSLKNWNYDKHMGIQEYAQKYHVQYIDMNLNNQNIGIDWSKDTRDKGDHLNYQGACKATKYLGQYLKNQNILTNHKKDKRYKHWNDNLQKYQTKTEKVMSN